MRYMEGNSFLIDRWLVSHTSILKGSVQIDNLELNTGFFLNYIKHKNAHLSKSAFGWYVDSLLPTQDGLTSS